MGAYLLFDGGAIHFDVVRTETVTLASTVTEHPVEKGADIADHVRDELVKVHLEVFVSNEPVDDVNGYGATTQMFTAKMNASAPQPSTQTQYTAVVNHSAASPTGGGAIGAVGGAINAAASAIGLGTPPPQDFTVIAASRPANPVDFQVQGQSFVGAVPVGFDFVKDMVRQLEELKSTPTLVDVVTRARYCASMVVTNIVPTPYGTGAYVTIDLKEIRTVASASVDAPEPKQPKDKPKVPKGNQQPDTGANQTIGAGAADALGLGTFLPPAAP